MQSERIVGLFDQQAGSYNQKWSELAAINGALHLLTSAVLSQLSPNANILCVGAGTGVEILYLARRFPRWRFTAVEPSKGMLDVFRRSADEHGISARCTFHEGFLDSLRSTELFDAATCFLVSQFILDRAERSRFFKGIADRLSAKGMLVSTDLASDLDAAESKSLVEVWFRLMTGNNVSPEEVVKMREAYGRDVAVLPPLEVREIIMRGGFESPVLFFQAGLIHGWYSRPERR
jgi:tRNA (cmo5U34)-methyltransferase